MCCLCSKVTIKTFEWIVWCCFGVFMVNFEHVQYINQIFMAYFFTIYAVLHHFHALSLWFIVFIFQFNDSPKAHFDYVWEHFVQPKLNIKHVAIVAHSYGGVVTVDGVRYFWWVNRVWHSSFYILVWQYSVWSDIVQ